MKAHEQENVRAALTSEPVRESTARDLVYFGAPPLVTGEDEEAYNGFLTNVLGCVRPTDIMEMMWVRDIVDLHWEVDRYRRVKVKLIDFFKQDEVRKALAVLAIPFTLADSADDDEEDDSEDTLKWLLLHGRDEASLEKGAEILRSERKFDEADSIAPEMTLARAVALKIDELERIDRMIMTMEARRDNACVQLEKRRAVLAQRVRHTMQKIDDPKSQEIQDAEFKEVDNDSSELKNAA